MRWLARGRLQALLDALAARCDRVLGPRVREGSLVFAEVRRVEDLPIGVRDTQEPGRHRLEQTGSRRAFDVVHGPGSLKPLTFAPREPLLQVEILERGFSAEPTLPDVPSTAVLGARPCDLAALAAQDRIFLGDRFPDPYYGARREALFLVALSCTRAVSTCFCTSMGTGPDVRASHDLALTELDDGFLVRAGSPAGAELLEALALPEPPGGALADERAGLDACARSMTRSLPAEAMPELLYSALEHPRWDDVAERCLSCGNCTLVCPTCFCHGQRDEPAADGSSSLRVREWNSCFEREHAQIHGLNFRPKIADRYRQWLVHKLASWIDQFGSSGCVGCGRCITWCPVGIDLTEEVAALARPPETGA